MDIKIGNQTLLSTPINVGAILHYELMQSHYILLPFSLETPIDFPIGSYVDVGSQEEGYVRFELSDYQRPDYNVSTGGYDYKLQLDAYYWKWKNKIFRYLPTLNSGGETDWSLTDQLSSFLGIFCRNLTKFGYTYNGTVFTFSIDNTVTTARKAVSFNSTNMIDALNQLADTFECEWWITDNYINFGRCEYNTAVDFEIGVNVETMSRADAKTTYATRVIAFGSTRNLPSNYRDNGSEVTVNGIVQKRLMLPVSECPNGYLDAEPNQTQEQSIEAVVIFDDIYPKVDCTVGQVSTYDSTVENEDGTTTTETFYRVNDTSGFLENFTEDMILDTLGIKFESGDLNGMEFDCALITDDATLGKCFEVIVNEDYGRRLPDSILHPAVGDKYIITGWDATRMAETGIIEDAEEELLDQTEFYIQKTKIDPNTYECNLMSDYAQEHTFEMGDRIRLLNPAYFTNGRVSRIIGYEIKLDIPYDTPKYYVGEVPSKSRLGSLEAEVQSLIYNGVEYTGTGGGGYYLITSNDVTKPTDRNAFSALASEKRYLRKDIIDKLKQGVQVGDNFTSGLLGEGGIFRMNQDGTYLEVDSMYVRMKAYFDTVEFRRYTNSGGNRISSPAGGKCVRVENHATYNNNDVIVDDDGYYHYTDGSGEHSVDVGIKYYRCFFRAKEGEGDDANEVQNEFAVGDQAYCHISNIREGSLYQHEFWRTVIGRNENGTLSENDEYWIDLANTSTVTIGGTSYAGFKTGSDVPVAQDSISTLGSKNDSTRRGAIIEYVVGNDSPSYKIYQGIGTGSGQAQFSLDNKNYVELGYNSSTGRAYLNVYGDFRFGSKTNTGSYITYNSSSGELNIKATINATSTIGSDSINTYIQEHAWSTEMQNQVNQLIHNVTDDLQAQIDGQITTLSDHGAPTGNNDPYGSLTPEQKEQKLGDIYIDIDSGLTYRYVKDGNTYYWMPIEDSQVQKAITDAATALGLANAKGRIFTTTANTLPLPPYDENDIWVDATYTSGNVSYSHDILVCVTPREANAQVYGISDWNFASRYTDDTKVNALVNKILHNTSGDASAAGDLVYAVTHAVNDGKTTLEGGLILTNIINLGTGNVEQGTFVPWSGINGVYHAQETGDSWKGHGIAAWYGGAMADWEVYSASHPSATISDAYAKSLFRFDGSGYLASGNISWTDDGKVYLSNLYTGSDTPISNLFFDAFAIGLDGSTSYINPNFTFSDIDIVRRSGNSYTITGTSVLNRNENDARYMVADRFFDLFDVYNGDTNYTATYKTSGLPSDTSRISIKAKFGFWTDSFISALGLGSDSGGGGASVLDDLTDVSINQSTLANGQVLTYQDGFWVNVAGGGGSLDPAAMWQELSTPDSSKQIDGSHLSWVTTNYYNKSAVDTALSNYVTLSGNQTIGGTKTFSNAIHTSDIYSDDFTFNDGGWLTVESGELRYRTSTASGNFKKVLLDGDVSNTDTKNTAGSTNNTGKKLFIVGALSQADNPQTYSNSNCYIGTDNCLYSGGTKVLTSHQSLSGYATQSWVNTQLASYLPLSGGTMTGKLKWNNSSALSAATSTSYVLCIDDFNSGGETHYITTDNLSVGKLKTARTLWGQSFNGTANVKGTITSDYFKLNDNTSNPYLQFSHTYNSTDYTYYVQAYQGLLQLGAGSAKSIKINTNGDMATAGHIRLDGAQASSSTGNTSQLIFRASGTEQVAISSNTNAIVINPKSDSYTGQVVLGVNGHYTCFRSTGNFGIGNSDSFSPSYKLHVVGTIYATGGVTSLSDMRMKNRLVDLDMPIEEFANLPLFYFKYKNGEDDYLHIGTSAQAVNEILPELVAKKDIWGLDYSVLGTAIGILNSRKLMNHEDRIKILEDENKALKMEINKLKGVA